MKLARLVASLVVLLLAVGAYAQPVTDNALNAGSSNAKDSRSEKEAFEAWRIATDKANEANGVVGQPPAFGVDAAVLDEGFEGATFPPDGWTAVVVAGATGWTSSTSSPHAGTKSAYNTYQSAGTLGSKWLITKRVSLVPSSVYTLSFWVKRGFSSAYPPDTVYVRLSTTDSLPASFSTQLYKCYTGTIADTSIDPNIYTTNYRKFTTTITGISGTAWIAFDHQDDDGQSIYLDDVNLDVPVPIDAGALLLASPSSGGCYGTNQTVSIRIKNYGSSTINFATNNLTVHASVAGPNPLTFSPVTLNSGTLTAGATQDVTVSTTYNMTASGVYTFDGSTTMAADSIAGDNAMPPATRTVLPLGTLPQIVDFTGYDGANLTTLFPDWKEEAGTNPTGTTSAWTYATGLSGGGNISARVNLYSTSHNEWIIGPKFLVTASTSLSFNAAVSNWNSVVVGDTMGSDDMVRVMVSTDCGGTWTSILQMDSTSNLGLVYTPYTLPLAAYSGQQIIIGFYATDGPIDDARDYDFHIDDIMITNLVPKDIQVLSVQVTPGVPRYVGTPLTIAAVIRNNGTEPNPASVPLTYKLGSVPGSQGDGVGQVFSPSWTGNLDTVVFTTTYTPGSTGNYTVHVKSFYAGDGATANDAASLSFHVFPPGALFEDWTDENAIARWRVIDNDGGGNMWIRTTGKYLSSPASIGSTYEGSTLRNDDWLITPKLSVVAGDSITFWHSIYSVSFPESLEVYISTTGRNIGDFTVKLGGFVDASTAWNYQAYSLSAYAGMNVYVAFVNKGLDEFTLYLDDIGGPAVYTPAVDLAATGFYQNSGLPTPGPALASSIMPVVKDGDAKPIAKLDPALAGVVTPASSQGTGGNGWSPVIESGPVSLKALVKNVGTNAASYVLNWAVSGSAQTPHSGPSVASGVVDTSTLSYTPGATGTFLTTGKITVAADEDADNDSTAFRMRIYPDTYVRQILDRNDNVVDTWVGWGSALTAMKAGIKFTASTTMQLAGLDMIYRTEAVTSGIIEVQVRAAGDSATAPGAVLYTKGYDAVDYFTGAGDYVMLPFDGTAPTITAGTDYWITLKAPLGILYPGGVHNDGFTAGHSFYEDATDTTIWVPLVITTERAWIMRSIGIPSGVATTVATGWNMVSNPVTTASDSMKQLFPTSLFPYGFGFAGAGGYQQRYRLANGDGFWGKFPGSASVVFSGGTRALDTIPVIAGWNMVGSISSSVDTSTIFSIPPGLRTSTAWFGYSAGYSPAASIQPGKGYWVKAGGAGSFVFAAGPAPEKSAVSGNDVLGSMNSLTIRDGLGRSQTLYFGEGDGTQYEMPPVPPEGAFDARFESAQGGAMLKTHQAGAGLPVSIQSAVAPMTISWNIRSGAYTLDAGQGLKTLAGQGSVALSGAPSRLTLRSTGTSAIPTAFALLQNYPNPFNPATTIRFALPVESKVSVEVFNALGQRVKTLVDGSIAAGFHEVEWNGTGGADQQMGSGVYFVRFSATGTDGRSFGDTRKLMLLK